MNNVKLIISYILIKQGLPFTYTGINTTINLKIFIMKNSFKIAGLALIIAVSFAACGGNNSSSTADTLKSDSVKTDSVKTDSTTVVDTTKKSTETIKK